MSRITKVGWRPVVGVLAVGLLVYGLSIQGAPAGSRDLTERGKVEATVSVDPNSLDPAPATEAAPVKEASGGKIAQPAATSLGDSADARFSGAELKNIRMGVVTSASPVFDVPVAVPNAAAGGGPGDPCICDTDCTPEAQCKLMNCVAGLCAQSNAPVGAKCNSEDDDPAVGFCTDDRCNSAGLCVAATGSPIKGPCPSECDPADDTGRNCDTGTHCSASDACIAKPGTTCNETADRCELSSGLGRCCEAGVCSYKTEGDCTGSWLRISDPDDLLHTCICPQYSAGVTPSATSGPELGVVVPSPNKCALTDNVCETNADCWWTCVGGDNDGESCDSDPECPGGLCKDPAALVDPGPNVCVPKAVQCVGADKLLTLGDDYTLNTTGYLRLKEFRLRAGVFNANEIVAFDFWDTNLRLVGTLVARFGPGDGAPFSSAVQDYTILVDCDPDCDNVVNRCEGVGHPLCEERLDPPFIIPPTGYVVARTRRLTTVQFGTDDSSFRWISKSSGGADVGSNDQNILWTGSGINYGGPVNSSLANDVLIMELVGEELPLLRAEGGLSPVAGACCDRDTAAGCADTDLWECAFCTGNGDPCDRASDCGLNRRLQICSTRDWKGPRTADEVDAIDTELCASNVCATGACCDGNGGCTVVASAAACSGGSTFLGFGTSCSPNPCVQSFKRCSRSHVTCTDGTECDGTLGACDAGTCYRADLRNPAIPCSVSAQDCAVFAGLPPTLCISNLGHCDTDEGATCADGSNCVPNDVCGLSGADCCRDTFECNETDAQAGTNCSDDASLCADPDNCDLVCSGPTPIEITVPDILVEPNEVSTLVISGDSDVATYKDECSRPGDNHPGWYEHFVIDKCAELTLNLCGVEPAYPAQAAWLTPRCPCVGSVTQFADVDENGTKSGNGPACNNDFCCDDQNFSFQVTVPAGYYQYEMSDDSSCANGTGSAGDGTCQLDEDCAVDDVCRSNIFPYQLTISARPCPLAACCQTAFICDNAGAGAACDIDDDCAATEVCVGSTGANDGDCVPECDPDAVDPCGAGNCVPTHKCNQIDKFTCESLFGDWLGDLDQPVAECLPGAANACTTGSCCVDISDCDDATLDTAAACVGDDPANSYHGGLSCDPLDNPDPCPVCPFNAQINCQTDTGQYIFPSDRLIGRLNVDDFEPLSNTINRVCWGGCFIGENADGSDFECNGSTGGTRPPQAWRMRFFDDVGGLPDDTLPLGDYNPLTIAGEEPHGPNSRCWIFSAILDPPLAGLVPENCYWVEISGLGEVQDEGLCVTHVLESNDGNNLRLQDSDADFTNGDIQGGDIFFCMDSGISQALSPPVSQDGGCGNNPVACCKPDGTCSDTDYIDCVGTPAASKNAWAVPGQLCGPDVCPGIPANDLCAACSDTGKRCSTAADCKRCGVFPAADGIACNVNADCTVVGETCNVSGETCDSRTELVCGEGWNVQPAGPRWDAQVPPPVFGDLVTELPNANKGSCEDVSATIAGELCDPASSGDCFDGEACTSWPAGQKAFRCAVPASNILASKDTPVAGNCPAASMNSDVWYEFTAPCTGRLSLRTCKNSGFDSMTALYGFPSGTCACPTNNANLKKCADDDICPAAGTTEGISVNVVNGECLLLALGGWASLNNEATAGRGETTFDIGFLCNLAAAVDPPAVPAAPHEKRKNRYISINPNNPGTPIILKVEQADNACSVTGKRCVTANDCRRCAVGGAACNINSDCGGGTGPCNVSGETCNPDATPTLLGYVGAPVADAFGNFLSVVVDAQPAARTFTETVVQIGDCEIRPDRTYAVSAASQDDPGLFSDPFYVGTSDKPQGKFWADVVGSFTGTEWTAPNYLVNVDDVVAFVKFQALQPARPHRTVLDLAGDLPTYVNNAINATDLQMILQGFNTKTFPPSAFAGYPANLADCSGN